MGTTKDYRGTKVLGGRKGKHKFGKIGAAIFHPTEPRVVGFVVKRGDLLLMIKREDMFCALDSLERNEDGQFRVTDERAAFGTPALKRLGVDYDKCIIWENMEMITDDGQELGRVGVVHFDDKTGKVRKIVASDGSTARRIIGSVEIPLEMIRGYEEGFLVLRPEASELEATGGLAAKMGAGSAKLKYNASKAASKTGEAVNQGAYDLGRGIGLVRDKIKGFKGDDADDDVERKSVEDELEDEFEEEELEEELEEEKLEDDEFEEEGPDDMADDEELIEDEVELEEDDLEEKDDDVEDDEESEDEEDVDDDDEDDEDEEDEEEEDDEDEDEDDEKARKAARAKKREEAERKIGGALGEAGSRFTSMFAGFKEEYDKARYGDD